MCVSSPWCCFSPPAPLDLSRTRVTDFAADAYRLSLMEKLGQPQFVVSRLCNVQGGTRERGAHRSELRGDARTAPIPHPRQGPSASNETRFPEAQASTAPRRDFG